MSFITSVRGLGSISFLGRRPTVRCAVASRNMHVIKRVSARRGEGAKVLMIIPAITFGLGCWQVKRRGEKLELIDTIHNGMHGKPVAVPSHDDHEDMEYRRVSMAGHFDHSKEMHLFPRASIQTGDYGTIIITPFRRKDNGEWVLVNRGWVPNHLRDATKRSAEAQPTGEIQLDAIVRKGDQGNAFVKNDPQRNQWFYRDVFAMAKHTGAQPYIFDATEGMTPEGGYPLGGQTRVDIRNEHMQYIVTWFSLSALTCGYCYYMFFKKKPPTWTPPVRK